MNKKTLLSFWLLLLCMIVGGASSAWGQSDKSAVYTNNVTLTAGSNSSACTVNEHAGVKCGASKKTGSVSFTLPSGTKYLHIHVAAWSGETTTISITPTGNGVPTSISLTADAGVSGSSTDYTLNGTESSTNFYKVITFTSALESDTKFTITSTKRFVIWGVNSEEAAVAITSIAFSEPKTATVGVGGTTTLSPTVLPANHTEVVDWESDATGVATVSNTGVVTGVAAGTAHITAKAHDNPSTIYDVCTVTVTAPVAVTGVSLKPSTTLLLGGTETLEAMVSPNDATNKNVTWSSADDTKVSVDENGVITGLALTGETPVNITVTTEDGSYEATCAVTVNPIPVSSVGLDKTSATLKVDQTLTLEATVSPDNATDKSVTWESDDEDVATVEDGEVTAVTAGTAKIIVKSVADPTKKAECTVTVIDGSIDLDATGEIEITSFPSFSGSGYQSPKPYTIGDYDWIATNCMLSSSYLQLRKSDGVLTSPTIKSTKGFTITVTVPTNSVTVSDGTSSASTSDGVATLSTTKTSTTITIAAGSAYAQVSKIKITPNKDPVATDVAITDPGTLAKDATGTFAYTITTEEDNTASWTSATTGVITITNAATGAYTAAGLGTSKITLTLTPTDATTYRAVTAERTITVTAPVEVSASDVEMTYGDAAKAIGATTSAGYAGTLTYASGNTSIATVDASGNVTAVAAGTTTITISAPADAAHYYTAGDDKEITVTVAAPEGLTTAKPLTPVEVTSYTLLSSSLPTGWTGDGNIWSGSSDYGAVTAAGTIGNSYDLTTPSINLNGNYTVASVTFEHTGNKTFSTSGTGRADACKLYVKDGDSETQLTISTMFAGNDWTYVTNTTDLTAYIGKTIQLIFRYTPSSGNQGKWEVRNFRVNATPDGTESVTVSESGYGTYCSLYPLDLDKLDSKVKAYTVTAVTSSSVTFTKITGTIKGGVPFILYGEEGDYTIPSAASSTVPAGNNLSGTLAPTYLTQINGDYTNFALSASNGDFRLIPSSGMTFPANKAYLPVLTSDISVGSARLAIIFEDDQTTTIQGVSVRKTAPDTYYNMKGQRVDNPKKGGIYVKNGKKVIFK